MAASRLPAILRAMKANKKVLDREAAVAFAATLAPQLAVAEALVDYGTNLIVRVMALSADGSIRHLVPVCTLAKQVVAMLDGITVLLRSGCGLAVYPLYRSLYEADLQMSWILEADTDQRARTYWVAHLLKEQRRCQSELKGSEYRNSASQQFPDMEWRDEAAIRAEIANIESALNRPEHATIRTESAEKRNRKFWAARLGCGTFEEIAKKLGRWNEYEVFYRLLSGMTHSSNPKAHFRKAGKDIEITDIRDPGTVAKFLMLSSIWTLRSYQTVLGHYRPDELPNFSRRYAEKWRAALRATPPVR